MKIKTLIAVLFANALLAPLAYAEPPTSATDIVRKAETEIVSRIKAGRDVSIPLESLIDYERISQDSLGVNWVSATQQQRDEFLSLFKALIRKSYERNLKHVGSYHTEWRGEERCDANCSLVVTDVVKNDGREEPLHVVYRVEHSRVVDIITEDSSMVSRYKSQFRRIILKSGFDGLLKKMRDKAVSY